MRIGSGRGSATLSGVESVVRRRFALTGMGGAVWAFALACTSSYGVDPARDDGGADASVEGAPLAEAGGDATSGDAGPTPGFCATRGAASSLFCADFDGADYALGWTFTSLVVDGGAEAGALSLTPSDRSPPSALLASTPAPGPGTAVAMLLTQVRLGGARAFAVEADLRLDQLPEPYSGSFVAALGVQLDVSHQLQISVAKEGLTLTVIDPAADGGGSSLGLIGGPPVGWVHLRLVVDLDTRVCGATLGAGLATGTTLSPWVLGEPVINVGSYVHPSPEPTAIAVDNVLVTTVR
jgi:hypothetical protein